MALYAAAGALTRPRGIPVLGYHSVDRLNSHISISPEMLDAQMAELAACGFTGVSLTRFLDACSHDESPPAKTVVLTFDDGLRNFLEEAAPVLARHGFTATNFVPVDCIGASAAWYPSCGLATLPCLSWDELRELATAGMDVQSHGRSHRWLTRIPAEAMRRDIAESRVLMEQELSKKVDCFCYPFGDHNAACVDAVREAGYRAAVTVEQGLFLPGVDDMLRIPRQNIDYINVDSQRTARLSARACVKGMFAAYVRTRGVFLRHRTGVSAPGERTS